MFVILWNYVWITLIISKIFFNFFILFYIQILVRRLVQRCWIGKSLISSATNYFAKSLSIEKPNSSCLAMTRRHVFHRLYQVAQFVTWPTHNVIIYQITNYNKHTNFQCSKQCVLHREWVKLLIMVNGKKIATAFGRRARRFQFVTSGPGWLARSKTDQSTVIIIDLTLTV